MVLLMRTYDEMFQRVLVRRDAYRAAQAVRRQKIRYSAMISSAAVMCGLLIAAGMQLGSPQHIPTAPTVMDMTTETTQTTVTERVTETNGTIPAEHTTDVPASETLPAETAVSILAILRVYPGIPGAYREATSVRARSRSQCTARHSAL